ncbi:MAG: hypothetical protein Q7R95_04205 [bacterium]|nr:hypothetical protein [bacterium]
MGKNVVMVSGSPLQCLDRSCREIPSNVTAVIITNNLKHPPSKTEYQLLTCQDHKTQIDVWIAAKSEREYGERKDLGYPNWLETDQEKKLGHALPPEHLELRRRLKNDARYIEPGFHWNDNGILTPGTSHGRRR